MGLHRRISFTASSLWHGLLQPACRSLYLVDVESFNPRRLKAPQRKRAPSQRISLSVRKSFFLLLLLLLLLLFDIVNLRIHRLFCRPPLLIPDTNVSSAVAGNLALPIRLTWPSHWSLSLCVSFVLVYQFDLILVCTRPTQVQCLYQS